MKPFAIESASQFRADGAPNLTSAQWANDMNETRLYGALDASLRTSTVIARYTKKGEFVMPLSTNLASARA
jgi:hypothetical protein